MKNAGATFKESKVAKDDKPMRKVLKPLFWKNSQLFIVSYSLLPTSKSF